MKIYISHSSDFDYKNKLYKPLRNSKLNAEHEIFLPHEHELREITRERIKGSDVLVAEVSLPSLGAGIEIGWADAFGVPIIAISEKVAKVSGSIGIVSMERFEYDNSEDMLKKLAVSLQKI